MNNYQEPEKVVVETADLEKPAANCADDSTAAAAERQAKEAKKMKIRKVLYPITIIAIILLWVSSLLGGE